VRIQHFGNVAFELPQFFRTRIVWGLERLSGRRMPAPFPDEFQRRAVELAREGDKSIPKLAEDLSIAESGLR